MIIIILLLIYYYYNSNNNDMIFNYDDNNNDNFTHRGNQPVSHYRATGYNSRITLRHYPGNV